MNYFLDWRNFQGAKAEKFFKTTLWQATGITIGLNCLEPGQAQAVHAHEDADKFYCVTSGTGSFTVGTETRSAGTGILVIAPAGVPHGVRNEGSERLSILVGIAPPIK